MYEICGKGISCLWGGGVCPWVRGRGAKLDLGRRIRRNKPLEILLRGVGLCEVLEANSLGAQHHVLRVELTSSSVWRERTISGSGSRSSM